MLLLNLVLLTQDLLVTVTTSPTLDWQRERVRDIVSSPEGALSSVCVCVCVCVWKSGRERIGRFSSQFVFLPVFTQALNNFWATSSLICKPYPLQNTSKWHIPVAKFIKHNGLAVGWCGRFFSLPLFLFSFASVIHKGP